MHPTARLGLTLIALFTSATLGRSADGTELPTTGLVPKVVETESLAENDHDFDTQAQVLTVDLRPYFTVAGLRESDGNFVQFKTTLGTFNAELLASDTPLSVANFKSYLATDSMSAPAKAKTYDQTFIHRSENISDIYFIPHVIIQGGGYRVDGDLSPLPTKPPVANEFKFANTRGTLAMAKLPGQPNSATSGWFININDNKTILGSDNNGGFTVFGRLLGNGIQVAETISRLPTYNLGKAFTNLPLRNVKPDQSTLYFTNLVTVTSVRIVPLQPPLTGKGASVLNYTVTSDNPSAVAASIANGVLTVKPGKLGGRAILTVRAGEGAGAFAESSFAINRDGPPIIVKQLPATTTAALGTAVTLTADITAWPLNIKWQFRPTKNDVWTDIPADDPRFTGVATEYLTIKLTGANPAAIGQAFALNNHQFRFRLTNDHGGTPRVAEGNPTTLRITTTLGFTTTPAFSVSNPLGSSSSGKPGATLTAPLGGTIVLSRPALLPATYPAPAYQWERLAPGSSTWEPLVNSVAAKKGSGTDENPEFPAVASPYSNVTTANLTIRLTGPEIPPANSTHISTAATLALHQSQYRCVIRHNRGAGDQFAPSPVTTLRITSLPVGIATQPAKMVYGLLTYAPTPTPATTPTTTISVVAKPAAANTPVKYQWQSRPTPQSEWVNLVNHVEPTAASDGPPPVAASPGAPTPYLGVNTATLTIRFPSDKNLMDGYGLLLDGVEYRCLLSNVLKDSPAPFGPAGGPVASNITKLRVLTGTVSLVTQENFRFPGLRDPATGVVFKSKGLPQGLTMDPATGVITGVPVGKPGVYSVTVTVAHGPTVQTFTYHIELLPLIYNSSGSYEALLSPADQPPAAKLTLTITSTGTLTGTLATTEEKNLLPLKGAVVRDRVTGVVSFQAPVVITRPSPAPKGSAYVLTDLALPPSGTISVKVHTRLSASAPLVELASATSVLIDDDNPSTDTKIEVGDPGLRLSTYTKKTPAPWAYITTYGLADPARWAYIKRYTLAFTDPVPLAPTELPAPAGSGYATATMAPDGKLSLTGKLGDGTKITATLSSDLAGDYRLFLRPYDLPGAYFSAFINTTGIESVTPDDRNDLFLRYTVAYSLGNTNPDHDFDDGAQVFWRRPAPLAPPSATANPVAYSAGFPPLGLRVRMEPWYFTAFDQAGFRAAADNKSATIDLVLSGAGMDNAAPNPRDLPDRLRLTEEIVPKTKTYAFTLKDATQPDASGFYATIDTNTGLFKGKLTLSDSPSVSRDVPFEGVLLPAPESFQVDWDLSRFLEAPAGKITAEGLGLVPALPGGAPATSRVTLKKSVAP